MFEADPAGQPVHTVDPLLLEYVPALQGTHTETLVAAVVTLADPAGQPTHEAAPPGA